MVVESAEEWGRRQAALAPPWSEERWLRVGALFGVRLVDRRPLEAGGEAGDGG